jgi:hypothetical protein
MRAPKQLVRTLKAFSTLKRINLLTTNIGKEAAAELACTLFEQNKSLTTLCGLEEKQRIAEFIYEKRSLDLSPEDGITIAADLRFNTALCETLTSVTVGSGIDNDSCLAVVKALRERQQDKVTMLSFKATSVKKKRVRPLLASGLLEIAEYVRGSSALAILDLSGSALGLDECAEGTKALFEALKVTTSLKKLKMENCSFISKTAEYKGGDVKYAAQAPSTIANLDVLAEALKVNKSLTHLSMSGSLRGDESHKDTDEAAMQKLTDALAARGVKRDTRGAPVWST